MPAPPPPPRPGPKSKPSKPLTGWPVVESYKYTFPHKDARPLTNLCPGKIPWESCKGVERSSEGKLGVLFVEFPDQEAVCIKAPVEVANEIFGTRLCKLLDVTCPEMRAVQRNDEEATRITESLTKAVSRLPDNGNGILQKLKSRAPLLIIEYVQGYTLNDKVGQHPDTIEWANRVFGLPNDALSEKGQSVLKQLGGLLAIDMLTNNYDRLPCIWENKGNPCNIMFDEDGVIAIDNPTQCPNLDHSVCKEIFQLVSYVARAVAKDASVENELCSKVRMFLKDGCMDDKQEGWAGLGIDIGKEGTCHVQTGFKEMMQRVVDKVTPDWLQGTKDELERTTQEDMENLNLKFCERVVEIFKEALGTADGDGTPLAVQLPELSVHMTCTSLCSSRRSTDDSIVDSAGESYTVSLLRLPFGKGEHRRVLRESFAKLKDDGDYKCALDRCCAQLNKDKENIRNSFSKVASKLGL